MDSRQRQPARPPRRPQQALPPPRRRDLHFPPNGAQGSGAEAERRRRTLLVAGAVGLFAIVSLAAPRMMAWQRGQFAVRLGRQAEAVTGEAAELTVRRLAEQGDHALGPLVRLAGCAHADASLEARRAVRARFAAWEFDARATGDSRLLGERLERLAAAIAEHAESFPPGARQWADGVALDMVAQCDALPAQSALRVLGLCDRAFAAPRGAELAAVAPGGDRQRNAETLAPPESRAAQGAPAPWSVLPRPLATAALEKPPEPPWAESAPLEESVAPGGPADPAHLGRGAELRLIAPPLTGPPTTPTPPGESLGPPGAAEDEPRVADLAEPARPLRAPDADAELVEVPSPQTARLLRRRLRQMSDSEVAAALAGASPSEAAAIGDVLRELQLTARGNATSRMRAPLTATPAPPRVGTAPGAAAAAGALPANEARAALRRIARGEAGTAEDRLEALTMLATSNDPALMAIAQERAEADADPRVAELATRILRDAIAK
ncbi:MAG TPA: hypothetical protein VEQ85_05640 [Lacipirellulaceae bacterium]|nr:hypothetical protein [Lacipirellulaceae bacterium]